MRVVDLTLPLCSGIPVYPGDPEVSIERIQTIEKEGWNMQRIQMNGHDGTHVNVPLHMAPGGKSLDDYALTSFFGPVCIYDPAVGIPQDKGVLFRNQNIDANLAEEIKKAHPPFVGLSSAFEFDVDVERRLLEAGIISYERLCNLEQLPSASTFTFYGLPLNIKGGDGSPVRAFVVVSND